MFKIWKWRFELKMSKIPNEEKMKYLMQYFWGEAEKNYDLVVSTGTFKEIHLIKHSNNKKLAFQLRTENVISVDTDKY